MNDLYYIEYKPELMLSDSMDMDAETELAHRRLCDFIWRMDKAPRADNEFLKQFTKTRASDWGRVKKGLLEKGWAEVNGLLLHKGAIETLNAAKEKYAAQCNQTAPATAKKNGTELKLTVCERDPATGIATLKVVASSAVPVTYPAATSETANVTKPVTTPQLEPQPKPSIEIPLSLSGEKGESPPKLTPKGVLQLRAEALMRRKPETPLTAGEIRAFKKNKEAIKATTEENWLLLERFYGEPQELTFCRKDLAALLNNWNGEIDRATRFYERKTNGNNRPDHAKGVRQTADRNAGTLNKSSDYAGITSA